MALFPEVGSTARMRSGLVVPLAIGMLACFALPAAGQTAVNAGYRDFSYGTGGSNTPTGEKPESKLWYNDGVWWGSLWNNGVLDCHIYKLNLDTQAWTDTGTTLDPRNSKADVLWEDASQKLYVASHVFTNFGQPNPTSGGRLF